MTSRSSQSQADSVKSLFDQAQPLQKKVEATIPTDVIMVGGYRKINNRKEESSFSYGEIAFEWNGSVIIKQLSQAVKGCPDYSTVVFATRGVGLDFDIIGAGKTKKVSIIQHFNWNDFAESDTISSLERYCVAATKKLTPHGQKSLIWKTCAENRLLITSNTIAIYASASVNNESLDVKIFKVLFRKDFDEALEPMLEKRSFLEKDFSFCPPENLSKVEQILNDLTDARFSVGWIKDDFNEFCREHKFFHDNDRSHLAPFILARTVYKLDVKQSKPYTIGEIQEALKESLQDTNQFTDEESIESVMKDNTRIFQLVKQSGITSFTLKGSVKSTYAPKHFWEMPIPADVLSALWLEAHNEDVFSDAGIAEAEDKKEVSLENLLTHEDESLADGQTHTVSENGKTDEGEADRHPQMEKEPTMTKDSNAEKEAIVSFWRTLKEDAGWNYSLRDIVRFHTSVRCEPLTILGGAPGSGKSSLARMYASYFGLHKDSFLSVDVQPSWHDRMDFLGFVKTHDDKHKPEFVPSETGVAKFLKDAETDNGESGLWLACLEEINLARPEHYFADFLQRISLDDSKRAKTPIKLHGLPEKDADKGSFTLVSSVRFVGTCNFDETTQNFSARFLDRCNYIEFQPMRIIDAFFPADGRHPKLLEFDPDKKSKWTWYPLETLPRTRMNTEQNKKDVTTLIKNCEASLKTLGVLPSPRVVSSMIRYIEARIDSVEDELTDEHDHVNTEQNSNTKNGQTGDDNRGTSTELTTVFQRAFDEAFAQRILSKLSTSRGCYPGTGTKTILEDLRGKLILNKVPLVLCSEMIEQYIRQFDAMMNG